MSLRMVWRGVDGSMWDLTDEASPVQSEPGLFGVLMAPFVQQLRQSALPGATSLGVSVGPREVRLPVRIADPTLSQIEWRAVAAAFMRSLSGDVDGQLAVIDEAGSERTLACRLLTEVAAVYDRLPELLRHQIYPLVLTALDPYWRGDPVQETFAASTDLTPHAQTTGTGDFWLVESAGVTTATISNPGDLPSAPLWTITGPTSGVVVGIGGSTIRYDDDLAVGDVLIIDTNPSAPVVTLNGSNGWAGISPGEYEPAWLPPGERVPLRIVSNGLDSGATVTVRIDTRYEGWA